MTDRAPDPRSARTVASLRDALRGSLRDRTLDEVNITELCRIADVRRTTFYTHYSSVAELLTEMLTAEIDEILSVPDFTDLSIERTRLDFHQGVIAAFAAVADDRRLFRVGFDSKDSALLRRSLLAMWATRLQQSLAVWHERGVALDVDPAVATPFVAGGLAASIEAWALSDETDAERWADALRDQMPPWWPRS